MLLCDALGVVRGDVVAFTGAGGKTSALVCLGAELKERGWRILSTTTTRIAEEELEFFPCATPYDIIESPQQLSELLTQHGQVFLYDRVWGGKALGLAPEVVSGLVDSIDSDVILVEADGSRRYPLKAPYDHEPVIPIETTLAVPVAGMDALGQPFNGKMVYNIEKIVDRYGFPLETPIQPAWIAQIVRDETLGLQGIPEGVRIIPLLNRVGDSMLHRLKARRAAQMILQQERIQAVALAQIQHPTTPVVEVQRRIAAIVLAGGLSRRMGQSKPLLPWGKQTVIEAIARRLLPLRLSDVVVVTGHRSTDVKAALKGTGARTVHNRRFASGEMLSSLQTGLDALDDGVSACMVFLGDQPQISARLVHQIMTAYAEGKGGIVAPSYMNRRGHPILIDRRYWPEILDLSDGSAPREVINAHSDDIAYVLTDDDGILRDMDTPEEYQAALRRAGLA
jgi:molybdenum cofactor cytidylyltransferase